MKTGLFLLATLLFCNLILSQNVIVTGRVGIGSSTPKGQLEIRSSNLGLVVPRVANVNAVTNGTAGQLAVDGTIVYDSLREAFMFRIDSQWLSLSIDNDGRAIFGDLTNYAGMYTYGKASNTGVDDWFGYSTAMNYDGTVLVVGAHHEDSNATGINGNQADNSAPDAGAVYVFVRNGLVWSQQAYIKASNTEAGDEFGRIVSVNADGNTIAVGARWEDSNAQGIDGNQADNTDLQSGAVYIFVRTAGVWSQQAYIKPSVTEADNEFAHHLDLSADGNTLAVGAPYQSFGDGQVFIFTRAGTIWTQQATILASLPSDENFGISLSISSDASRLAVGAIGDNSSATGINGNPGNGGGSESGAVLVFYRSGSSWIKEAYVKASNTGIQDEFGGSVNLNHDGSVLVVGAKFEDSNATGINGSQSNDLASNSGAVYVFVKSYGAWFQQAYIKASNTGGNDEFGTFVHLSREGDRLIIGAPKEDSSAEDFNGSQSSNTANESGAVYDFRNTGATWSQLNYIKASNTGTPDSFGQSVGLSANGRILVVGAYKEASSATGFGGYQYFENALGSGAIYIIK